MFAVAGYHAVVCDAFILGSDKTRMLFFPLINIKMPIIVGILSFMSRKNTILDLFKPEKCCISSQRDDENLMFLIPFSR